MVESEFLRRLAQAHRPEAPETHNSRKKSDTTLGELRRIYKQTHVSNGCGWQGTRDARVGEVRKAVEKSKNRDKLRFV